MDLLKRLGGGSKVDTSRGSTSRTGSPSSWRLSRGNSLGSPGGTPPPRNPQHTPQRPTTPASTSTNSHNGVGDSATPGVWPANVKTPDPETCFVVFKSHWSQAWAVMAKLMPGPGRGGPIMGPSASKRTAQEDVETVLRYMKQMSLLLVEESPQGDGMLGQGPVLQLLLQEDILDKLLTWSTSQADPQDRLRLHQLKTFELLIGQSQQQLLIHKPVIRPLLRLLKGCSQHANQEVETHLLLILHQLCIAVTKNTQLLELLFDATSDHGPAKFLMFSLLIPYIHREGSVGQQARDALLLIMALSAQHDDIGNYVADNSDFCPVLATGLSGLYSSLPRQLHYSSDDWHCITTDDLPQLQDLNMFLNSLEFCNAVIQVAHPLVRSQLLLFIYNGFLQPVLGPALHQNEITFYDEEDIDDYQYYLDEDDLDILKLPMCLIESYFASSMEEVIATTAYLDLFLRRLTEPALVQTFLRFILVEKHDEVCILESLIMRINSNSRLCMTTLSLFRTLIDLNCEDVMFQLIFKYLIPCTHVMVSQRRAVRDVDLYSRTAEKIFSLKPACCMAELPDTPPDGGSTPKGADSISLSSSSFVTNYFSIPENMGTAESGPSSPANPNPEPNRRFKSFSFGRKDKSSTETDPQQLNYSQSDSSSPDLNYGRTFRFDVHQETNYLEYLTAAHHEIMTCTDGCKCWKYTYDGEKPRPDCVLKIDSEGHFSVSDAGNDQPVIPSVSVSVDINSPVLESNSSQSVQTKESVISTTVLSQTGVSRGVETLTKPGEKGIGLEKVLQDTDRSCRDSCGESVTSEADSALSTSSTASSAAGHSEHLPHTPSTGGCSTSRADSPMVDSFDNAEFNAFILSLKRVKTPVEFSDSSIDVEESFHEIDELVNELHAHETQEQEKLTKLRHSSCEDSGTHMGVGDATPATFVDSAPVDVFKPHSVIGPDGDGFHVQKQSVASGGAIPKVTSTNSSPAHAPGQYRVTIPNIGPFLTTLLNKLEMMMQNTLYVNLLLTGLVTRLACYQQPLLRSFLLNHSLVFQPTVKSLIQVLGSVKHKVDCYSYTVKDFDSLLLKARQFLAWREDIYLHGNSDRGLRMGTNSGALRKHPDPSKEKRKNSISDIIFRRTSSAKKPVNKDSRLQLLNDKSGFRYMNRAGSPQDGNPAKATGPGDLEALKTKNAVYCALVLEEFLKELAAISQEHAVLCTDIVPSSLGTASS